MRNPLTIYEHLAVILGSTWVVFSYIAGIAGYVEKYKYGKEKKFKKSEKVADLKLLILRPIVLPIQAANAFYKWINKDD